MQTVIQGGKAMRNDNFLKSINFRPWWIAALSPFIYLGLGLWFGWWWAWVIMPVSVICCLKIGIFIKAALVSPFVYLFMGLMFGWWTEPWAWFMIPITIIAAIGNAKRPKGSYSHGERSGQNNENSN